MKLEPYVTYSLCHYRVRQGVQQVEPTRLNPPGPPPVSQMQDSIDCDRTYGGDAVVMLLLRWLLSAVALMVVAYVVPGIHVGLASALIAAIVIGLINATLRPVFLILTLPLTLFSFGLFALVINAVLFGLAAWLVPGFTVHGFAAAFVGSILYAIVGWVLHLATDSGRTGVRIIRHA